MLTTFTGNSAQFDQAPPLASKPSECRVRIIQSHYFWNGFTEFNFAPESMREKQTVRLRRASHGEVNQPSECDPALPISHGSEHRLGGEQSQQVVEAVPARTGLGKQIHVMEPVEQPIDLSKRTREQGTRTVNVEILTWMQREQTEEADVFGAELSHGQLEGRLQRALAVIELA